MTQTGSTNCDELLEKSSEKRLMKSDSHDAEGRTAFGEARLIPLERSWQGAADQTLRLLPQLVMSSMMMLLLCCIAVDTCALSPVPTVTAQEDRQSSYAQAYLEEGKRELQRGNYSRAIRLLSAAIKSRANAYNLRGQAYFLSGDRARALEDINRYLSMQKSDPAALLLRGDVALSLGKPAAALADYRAASQLAPSSAEAHVSVGLACLALERYSSAVRALDAALEIDPQNKSALSNLGVAHMLAQRPYAARKYFNEALRLETDPKWRKILSEWIHRLPPENESLQDRDLPVEDDLPEGEPIESVGQKSAATTKELHPANSFPQPTQQLTRQGFHSIPSPLNTPRMKGTHLSGKWEATYKGVRITLDVNNSGSSLSGVLQVNGPFGRESTYHFTGTAGFDGSIRAAHYSGHRFEGKLTDDGRIVGTVTTRFGTTLPIDFAPR